MTSLQNGMDVYKKIVDEMISHEIVIELDILRVKIDVNNNNK